MQQDADITVVVTSCNRHDLLARTLASFRAHETEGRVARILVAEDGDADPAAVCAQFGAEHFCTGERVGQIRLIDQAYARVQTPYIFHLEDDWEFYRSGFMQKSRALLERDPKILLVQLRAWNDTNGHPLSHAAPAPMTRNTLRRLRALCAAGCLLAALALAPAQSPDPEQQCADMYRLAAESCGIK